MECEIATSSRHIAFKYQHANIYRKRHHQQNIVFAFFKKKEKRTNAWIQALTFLNISGILPLMSFLRAKKEEKNKIFLNHLDPP